jgi:hypothetical protein
MSDCTSNSFDRDTCFKECYIANTTDYKFEENEMPYYKKYCECILGVNKTKIICDEYSIDIGFIFLILLGVLIFVIIIYCTVRYFMSKKKKLDPEIGNQNFQSR